MYNVRVKRFLDTLQVQVFDVPMQSAGCIDRRDFDKSTGEILPFEQGHWENNPFTGKLEKMVNMGDSERSLAVSKSRTIHKIYDIARSNYWEWFITLTFNPEKVDSFDYSECTKKLSKWLNNIRSICPEMKYIVVPEQHKSGRWHFHGLFSNVDSLSFVDSGLIDKKGKIIYNVGNYKLGFTTATKIDDLQRTCSYLCKYITKDLCILTKGKKRYWSSRNVDLPIVEEYMANVKDINDLLDMDDVYIKTVHSEYATVRYIETSIYTTNTDFSKRLI